MVVMIMIMIMVVMMIMMIMVVMIMIIAVEMMMKTTYDKHGKLLGLKRNAQALATTCLPHLTI